LFAKLNSFKLLCLFFFALFPAFFSAQDVEALKVALKDAKHDTVKCKILMQLSETASDEEWPQFNEQLKNLSETKLKALTATSPEYIKFKKYYAAALNNCGYLANQQGKMLVAMDYYNQSIKIQQEINDKKGIAASYNNIGFIYKTQGDIIKALDYYNKSMKILEELCLAKGEVEDKKGLAYAISNIAIIYQNQDEVEKALEYNLKSLKIREDIGDKQGLSLSLNNIGYNYKQLQNYDKALEYFTRSLKLKQEVGDKQGEAVSLNNIGFIYQNQNKLDLALEYYNKSLKIEEALNDKSGLSFTLNNIATICLKQNKKALALEYAQRCMKISREAGYTESISNVANVLGNIYRAMGDYKRSLESYELHIQMRDSIKNESTRKASIRSQLKYDFDKKAAADSVANAKEKEIKQAQINQQQAEIKAKKNQQYALYGGLILVLIFAGFMYNRFKITQKQNSIITHQKHLIEEKHKEITDSINYAERIQRSFLATKNLLDENLKEYFVFFQPKAVVSGDFYWASSLSNGNFIYATADSTGHGVPGAIMSILNISSLEKAIEKDSQPAAVLNETRKAIIERLKKDGTADGGKDGMDCSLIVLDKNKKQLTYALANNPLWIVRANSLLEFAPDKMPVGKHDKDQLPFAQHTVELNAGDIIYTFSDGFPDQFGGEKGKKFMYKKLKELLLSIAHLSMPEQEEKLRATVNTWKGKLEQTDDITVIGVRV